MRAQGSATFGSAPRPAFPRSREVVLRSPSEGALHPAQVTCWWLHIQPCFQHCRASQYSLLEPKLGLLNVRLGAASRPVYPPDSSERDGHLHLPPAGHLGAAAPRAHGWALHTIRKPRITPIGQPRPPARGQNPLDEGSLRVSAAAPSEPCLARTHAVSFPSTPGNPNRLRVRGTRSPGPPQS